jgi:hypothetical protein
LNKAQQYNIETIIKHEDYDEKTLRNDIAIFVLKNEVKLSDLVQIACLPDYRVKRYPISDNNVESWVSGWGKK